jgi:hypothetical protein
MMINTETLALALHNWEAKRLLCQDMERMSVTQVDRNFAKRDFDTASVFLARKVKELLEDDILK